MKSSLDTVDGGDQRDFIHADVDNLHEEEATNSEDSIEETCRMIDYVAKDLKRRLQESPPNEQLFTGARKFVQRYLKYSSHQGNVMLASALHRFGWVFGGAISSNKFGSIRYGKRITVQATAAGRRRGQTRGKAKMAQGRPIHHMTVWNEPKGKRLHDLAHNISKGQQNAGKW